MKTRGSCLVTLRPCSARHRSEQRGGPEIVTDGQRSRRGCRGRRLYCPRQGLEHRARSGKGASATGLGMNPQAPQGDPRAATTKPPGFGGVIRVQALTSCRWYTRSCRKQRPSESVANAEPFEHWPGDDHWSRSTLSKLRAIISAAAASSAETTACSCDQRPG